MKGLLGVIVVVGIGVFVWMQLGGSISGSAPTAPNPRIPHVDPNDAANKAVSGANKAADTIAGLSSTAWSVIVLATVATAIYLAWTRRPGFRWAIIGGCIMLLFFLVAVLPKM